MICCLKVICLTYREECLVEVDACSVFWEVENDKLPTVAELLRTLGEFEDDLFFEVSKDGASKRIDHYTVSFCKFIDIWKEWKRMTRNNIPSSVDSTLFCIFVVVSKRDCGTFSVEIVPLRKERTNVTKIVIIGQKLIFDQIRSRLFQRIRIYHSKKR